MGNEFSTWIRKKYNEFASEQPGSRGSVSAFARQFGAPHQVVLGWMRPGANPPREQKYTQRLIGIYGKEAYQAMGIPVPAPGNGVADLLGLTENEKKALALMRQVPSELQPDVLDIMELYLLRHGFRRVG